MTEIEQLRKDKDLLDWLERFLQLGGASVFTSVTARAHEDRTDDTEATRWNHPFSIGYEVEVEHRGCYRWEELANGAKGIRPAIAAARAKYEANARDVPTSGTNGGTL
jgi:hypothetical protein